MLLAPEYGAGMREGVLEKKRSEGVWKRVQHYRKMYAR